MKLPFATDQGTGSRATLGAILLQTDETLEGELAALLPGEGVALHISRVPVDNRIGSDTLAAMREDLPAAASLLPSAPRYDAVAYACTSGATVIGPEGVRDAIRSRLPGVNVTEPLSAIIAALNALGARQIGFLTPYVAEVSARMRECLEQAGMEIAAFGSFEESDDRVVARITPDSIRKAIEALLSRTRVDAVVVACTNLRALPVIVDIERRTGVPVISSNTALAWHMMRLAGLDDEAPAGGSLFGVRRLARTNAGQGFARS